MLRMTRHSDTSAQKPSSSPTPKKEKKSKTPKVKKTKKVKKDTKRSKEDKKNARVTTEEVSIGVYTITSKVLGMGSFGTVYYGYTVYSPIEEVAVKIVRKKDLTETRTQRLKSEIDLLKQLDHPNIVKLLNVYENDDNVYLVFEYKTGDLYNYVQKNGIMNEMLAMKIFNQLVDAIEFCHSKGIAHLDVKLENILIDEDTLDVYLADFGFATTFAPGTVIEKWCGSPFTVAPEIIIRKPYEPALADIWALGSVLYTVLCGSYPFQSSSVNDTLIKTKSGKMNPFQSNVGYSVRDLITKLLVLDAKKRFSIRQIRKHPWFQLAAGFSRVPEKIRTSSYGTCATAQKEKKRNSPRHVTKR